MKTSTSAAVTYRSARAAFPRSLMEYVLIMIPDMSTGVQHLRDRQFLCRKEGHLSSLALSSSRFVHRHVPAILNARIPICTGQNREDARKLAYVSMRGCLIRRRNILSPVHDNRLSTSLKAQSHESTRLLPSRLRDCT